ncbi:putative quinol monooxygenase [uncultured Amnibacterium sp.]|uniref:putative quinol monooxygenase n=1 Tax=uncultured Amnibacterium sp. TaxID=1631851 RepID=UPI0035CC95B1
MPVTSLLELHLREDRLDEAPALIDAILQQTRAFDGNRGLEVVEDVADRTHVTVVEHWESLQHDDAYRAWRATPEGASNLGDLLAGPPVLTRYEVRSTL